MKEEHKIQIRVQSKTEQRMMEDLNAEMISEWDVKKIVMSLCCLLLLVASIIYYFFAPENPSEMLNKKVEAQEVTKAASFKNQKKVRMVEKKVIIEKQRLIVIAEKEPFKTPVKKQETTLIKLDSGVIKHSQYIKRGLLVKRTINKEPSGVVNLPLVVNKDKAISLTYFTEIINMQGNSVYHEWLINNKVIYKKKINVLGDRWRVSTRKLFSYTAIGQWQVRVVNNKGDILHKINFLVTK